MARKISGIIFDLDGVIVHTDKFHYQAWKRLADRIGVEFDETINNRLRGVSRLASLDIILERSDVEYNDTQKAEMAEEKNECYRELLAAMNRNDVTDDVRDTLQKLREKGYHLAIGSSSKNTKYILERTELTDMFDAISDGTNISRSKPDPEVFEKAAEYLGLPAEKCVVIEDAVAGIEAGRAAGMMTVAIGDAALNKAGDFNIANFGELLNII